MSWEVNTGCQSMYDTAEYAQSRLSGTIVRVDKDPIVVNFCDSTRGGIAIGYSRLINPSSQHRVMIKDVDLTPVPLGFANTTKGVSYLTRVPKRSDYRQGLRSSNYTSVFGNDHRMVSASSLYKTIVNKFVCFEQALDEVTNTDITTAFNREFALIKTEGEVKILYKWKGVVGDIVNNIPALLGEHEYLQESLEEALNGTAS